MIPHLRVLKPLLCCLFALLALPAIAQPTCSTLPGTNGNNNTVLFNVQNTNSFAIQVSALSTIMNTGAAGTYGFEVLYNTAAINSNGSTWTQGVVGVGQNGWQSGGTGVVTLGAH